MSDSLKIWGTDYTGVKGFKASDTSDNQYTYIHPQGAKSISQNGEGIDVSEYASVNVRVQGGSTTEITISDSGAVSQELQPSTVYHFTSTALTYTDSSLCLTSLYVHRIAISWRCGVVKGWE